MAEDLGETCGIKRTRNFRLGAVLELGLEGHLDEGIVCVAEGVVDDVHHVGVVSYDGWVPCLEFEMICEESILLVVVSGHVPR